MAHQIHPGGVDLMDMHTVEENQSCDTNTAHHAIPDGSDPDLQGEGMDEGQDQDGRLNAPKLLQEVGSVAFSKEQNLRAGSKQA